MRPRIKKLNFKKGDVVKSALLGVPKKHICIILEDERSENHVKCISVCNLTSKPVPDGEYGIDVSKYKFPADWFEEKQPETWLRCNDVDCIYKHEISELQIVGNLLELYPELWSDVCLAVYNCPISEKLQNICDCDNDIIEKQIRHGIIDPEDCGCG